MKHVLITRCKFDDDELFQKYFSVMKKTYIPSINSQTDKNFSIALIVNPKHFELIRKEINNVVVITRIKFIIHLSHDLVKKDGFFIKKCKSILNYG
jgi:hypothetical protein